MLWSDNDSKEPTDATKNFKEHKLNCEEMTLTINIYGNNISVQSSSDTPAIIDQQIYKAVKSIVEKFNDK